MFFVFVLFYFIDCVSLLFPSIHDDVREVLVTFGKGERGGVFYISLSSLKIVDTIYAGQHCGMGATQTTKKSVELRKNSCTIATIVMISQQVLTVELWEFAFQHAPPCLPS